MEKDRGTPNCVALTAHGPILVSPVLLLAKVVRGTAQLTGPGGKLQGQGAPCPEMFPKRPPVACVCRLHGLPPTGGGPWDAARDLSFAPSSGSRWRATVRVHHDISAAASIIRTIKPDLASHLGEKMSCTRVGRGAVEACCYWQPASHGLGAEAGKRHLLSPRAQGRVLGKLFQVH